MYAIRSYYGIRPLIKQKDDPEIESIIRAISNSGFYKELRLEDANFTISQRELLDASTHIDLIDNWKITKVFVDPKFGKVEKIESDAILNKKLEQLDRITSYNVCYTKLLRLRHQAERRGTEYQAPAVRRPGG